MWQCFGSILSLKMIAITSVVQISKLKINLKCSI